MRHFLSFLIIASFAFGCRSKDEETKFEEDDSFDRDKLVSILYEPNSATLHPVETLRVVLSLREVYQDNPGRWPEEEVAKVEDLYEASQVSENKCSIQALNEVKVRIERNSEHRQNILPYLKFQLKRQYNYCKPILESLLEFKVEALSEKVRRNLAAIRESVLGEQKDLQNLSPKDLQDGVLSLLAKHASVHLSEFSEGDEGEELLNQDFNRLINKPCLEAKLKFKDPIERIKVFTNNVSLKRKMSKFANWWYEIVEVCGKILSKQEALCASAHKRIEKQPGSESKEAQADKQVNQSRSAPLKARKESFFKYMARKLVRSMQKSKKLDAGRN